jgi:CHAD domain-containing protein
MPRTAATVLRSAAAACADRLLVAEPLIRADRPLPDGDTPVHYARVACRRLRSDLRTFARLLDDRWAWRLSANLKWLAGLLGAARDAEVLRARLGEPSGVQSDLDVAPFDEALRARGEAARAELLPALDSARFQLLLTMLREPAFRGRARRPAKKALAPPAQRQVSRFEEAEADLTAESPDVEWHEVRILAKRARYALDTAGRRKQSKRIAKVQGLLGEHQDAVVAAQAWHDLAEADPETALRLIEREHLAAERARAAFLAARAELDR